MWTCRWYDLMLLIYTKVDSVHKIYYARDKYDIFTYKLYTMLDRCLNYNTDGPNGWESWMQAFVAHIHIATVSTEEKAWWTSSGFTTCLCQVEKTIHNSFYTVPASFNWNSYRNLKFWSSCIRETRSCYERLYDPFCWYYLHTQLLCSQPLLFWYGRISHHHRHSFIKYPVQITCKKNNYDKQFY